MTARIRTRNTHDDEPRSERYLFSSKIAVRAGVGEVVNPDGWSVVQGCTPISDPREAVIWKAPMQMVQVAPGHRWCKTCAEVRPNSYFDVLEWDERGKPTKWLNNDMSKPIEWDGKRFPKKYADECRQCINGRDPTLAKEKFCSACKTMHPREDFADDTRYADKKFPSCYQSEAKRKAAGRARDAWVNEGRTLRQWNSRAAG